MTGPDVLFSVIVAMAFCASLIDHYWVGQHNTVNKPVRAFLLGCFIITETWIALDGKPAMLLYVSLNFFGLYMLFIHKKITLGAIWLKRRNKWFKKGRDNDGTKSSSGRSQ